MANRLLHNPQHATRAIVELDFHLRILGNTTPANGTFSIVNGEGAASFTRSGTGEYTLTLSDAYASVRKCQLTALAATAIDLVPQLKSVDVVSAKTIVFKMQAGATPTDSANGVTHEVFLSLSVKNSSVR